MSDPIHTERRQVLRLLAVTTAAAGAAALSPPALAAKCETDGTPLQFVPKTAPDPNPQDNDIAKYPKCPYCGMDRKQYHHSRHLVHYQDDLADGTCSLHCAAISLALNLDRGPKAIYAADFGATAIIASTCAGLSILPIALGNSAAVAGLGFVGVMSFTSLRYPAFYVYIMERTPERLRAIMNGTNEMAAGLSFAGISLVAGYIIVHYGYGAAFVTGALITLLGTLIFWLYVQWGSRAARFRLRRRAA